ncbi:MAG: energy transducer TonB [Lysobacteraceae bacterium]|jgi:TonB family protein
MPVHSYLRKEFGTVRLELGADSEGNASEVRVLESSGHPRLDTAAFHQVSGLSISSGELTEDMRNGRVKKQVQVTFPARLHNLSDDRITALTAMTCGEAMKEFGEKVGGATGTALVLVPPFSDVLPVLSPFVEVYAELVNTPPEEIDRTFNGQMLAADVMLGPVVHHLSRVQKHCEGHPDQLFLDSIFSWEKGLTIERDVTDPPPPEEAD